jgi:hypothetical protein
VSWQSSKRSISIFAASFLFVSAALVLAGFVRQRKQNADDWVPTEIPGLLVSRLEADFGTVPPGTTRQSVFNVINQSSLPIYLQGCVADCSCVSVDLQPSTLKPGDSRAVEVSIDTPAAPQLIHHRVVVYARMKGNQNPSTIVLTVRGSTLPAGSVEVFPRRLEFGTLAPGDVESRYIYVIADKASLNEMASTMQVLVTNPARESGMGTATTVRLTSQPSGTSGIKKLLLLFHSSKDSKSGPVEGKVLFLSNQAPPFEVSIHGNVLAAPEHTNRPLSAAAQGHS